MGKNLKGRELGEGLSQCADGRYLAQYTNRYQLHVEHYFDNLADARNWLAEESRMESRMEYRPPDQSTMTVDEWFTFWTTVLLSDRAPNTLRNYRERYQRNIQPIMGTMPLSAVKPMHCIMVLNRMEQDYAGSTIRQTYICMGSMFKAALNNDMITKHPMDGIRFNKPIRDVKDIRFLSLEEQQRFMAVAQNSHNFPQYALILETGLRTGGSGRAHV